jgi:GT2 family glycosyltransferase
VDGASTDETIAVAKKHGRSDAIIVSERDNGLYDAINKGIAIATGDIIGTLNADDFYPHDRIISIIQSVFENSDIDACYGDLVFVDRKDSSRVLRYWRSSPYNDKLISNGWMPPHPTFFVRRSVYQNSGAYRLDMGTAADYEFLLRALAVDRIHAVYIPTLITVMRTGGLSSSGLRARLRANRRDRKAWDINGLQPKPWTLLAKPIRKSTQYIFKKAYSKPWLDDEFLKGTDERDREEELQRVRRLGLPAENCADHVALNGRTGPPFYVVTVNYHDEDAIARMIESLRSTDIVKKLIIVDHSNSDSLNSISADFPISIIRQPNRGYGAGLNRGLRQILDQDAIVMLCNPDIEILHRNQLVAALNYLTHNRNIGCLIPKVVTRRGGTEPSARRFYTLSSLLYVRNPWIAKRTAELVKNHYYMEKDGTDPYEIDWGSGSTMFVRSSLFPYPISFDERFFLYFEDVDLCVQMWRNGFSVVHYPSFEVCHSGARLSKKSIYYFAVHLTSLVKFIKKYRGLPQRNRFSIS